MTAAARFVSASGSLALTTLTLASFVLLQGGMRKDAPAAALATFALPMGAEDGADKPATPDRAPPVKPAATVAPPQPVTEPVIPPQVPAPAMASATPAVVASAAVASPPAEHGTIQAAAQSAPAPAAQPTPVREPPRKGARDGLDSDAPAGTSRSYAARIRSWIYANRIYPKRSRMRREEGVVRVRFVLDRRGNLLEGSVVAGSGFAALDEEGNALLFRATPFPAAPRDVTGERIEFVVPIEFVLP